MTIRPYLFFSLTLLAGLGLALGCRPSPEARVETATTLVRAMDQDLLAAQKRIVDQFNALPEADGFRLALDPNLDSWDISSKNLAEHEEALEKGLISLQKDAKEDALIGEYRLYAKKLGQAAQEQCADFESRLIQARKDLATGTVAYQGASYPMNDAGRKIHQALVAILPMEIRMDQEVQKITATGETRLGKLLG